MHPLERSVFIQWIEMFTSHVPQNRSSNQLFVAKVELFMFIVSWHRRDHHVITALV